ncbi:MAG: hypothetical protein R3E39_17780 [Anaerolineae bacterium]
MVESPVQVKEPIKKLAGIFNELELYPDHLLLRHTDLLSRFFGHEEIIPVRDIKAVYVYPAQFVLSGWLRIMVEGHDRKPIGVAFRMVDERQARDMQAAITECISSREVASVMHHT